MVIRPLVQIITPKADLNPLSKSHTRPKVVPRRNAHPRLSASKASWAASKVTTVSHSSKCSNRAPFLAALGCKTRSLNKVATSSRALIQPFSSRLTSKSLRAKRMQILKRRRLTNVRCRRKTSNVSRSEMTRSALCRRLRMSSP